MLVVNILIYGFGAHIFLNFFFPNQYHSALFNMSFNLILMYSYAEFYLNKLYNSDQFSKIRQIINNSNKKMNEIDIIKCNNVIMSNNRRQFELENINDFDFIIFSDYESMNESSNKINKVLYYKNSKEKFIKFNYKICDFTFISININVINNINNNETIELYSLKLCNDNENYYIVGNKINKLFVYYLLKKQYNVIFDDKNYEYEYKLILIDQNVNIKTFSEKEEIILIENDYSVN